MAKFYGAVGYVEVQETGLDIYTNVPVERMYRGDIEENSRRLENGEGVNDDVKINNRVSIVADAYAYQHMHALRYVKWMGVAWKATSVVSKRPRLIITLGGVYNGEIKRDP